MANYFHGVSTRQNDTSISTPVTADSGIAFVVGAAPVIPWAAHRTTLSCVSLTRKPSPLWGIATIGRSTPFAKLSIRSSSCTAWPVVFVNVLDPAKHKKSVAEQNYPVADGKVLLPSKP